MNASHYVASASYPYLSNDLLEGERVMRNYENYEEIC